MVGGHQGLESSTTSVGRLWPPGIQPTLSPFHYLGLDLSNLSLRHLNGRRLASGSEHQNNNSKKSSHRASWLWGSRGICNQGKDSVRLSCGGCEQPRG